MSGRGQNLGFWGSSDLGDTPGRGDFVSGTHIYHHAKFHADRCHRRRYICNRTHTYTNIHKITADLTLYGHIKTAEQQAIIQLYGDWYTGR